MRHGSENKVSSIRLLNTVVWWLLAGLRRGVTRFAGSVEVAAIIGSKSTGELKVYDSSNILADHRGELSRIFQHWPNSHTSFKRAKLNSFVSSRDSDDLVQTIFVRGHLMKDASVLEAWLHHAYDLLQNAHEHQMHSPTAAAAFRISMEHGAPAAVASAIEKRRMVKHSELFDRIRVEDVLKQVARLSQGVEEGERPSGRIAFLEENPILTKRLANGQRKRVPVRTIFGFKEKVRVSDHKHTVKLLQIVQDHGCLAGSQDLIYEVLENVPSNGLVAEFQNGIVDIKYADRVICQIVNGDFCYPRKTHLRSELQGVLKMVSEECFESVLAVIQSCRQRRKGCLLVLTDQGDPKTLMGHELAAPLVGQRNYLNMMALVDGAVFINFDGTVYGFGYMLDGSAQRSAENRSRGSRFNSAVRYSAKLKTGFVIVVSADGPVRVIKDKRVIYTDRLQEADEHQEEQRMNQGMDFVVWSQLEGPASFLPGATNKPS
jgi:hypothetical protein